MNNKGISKLITTKKYLKKGIDEDSKNIHDILYYLT